MVVVYSVNRDMGAGCPFRSLISVRAILKRRNPYFVFPSRARRSATITYRAVEALSYAVGTLQASDDLEMRVEREPSLTACP
jgi:hypothetical protein